MTDAERHLRVCRRFGRPKVDRRRLPRLRPRRHLAAGACVTSRRRRRRRAVAPAAYLQRRWRRLDAAARRRPGVEPARVVAGVEVDRGAVGGRGTGAVARHHVADVGLVRAAERVYTGNDVAFCDTSTRLQFTDSSQCAIDSLNSVVCYN